VLADLVEDCLSEDNFFSTARDLVQSIYNVAADESKPLILRALAVGVFKGCFDTLEMVLESHRKEIEAFATDALAAWIPFFLKIMQTKMPQPPSEDEESQKSTAAETYRGLIALKIQVVKVLMRIRSVFPSKLAPQSPALFSAAWEELSSVQAAYHHMFISEERQGRLEDDDGLPYTLDFLVLEELDFMQACLRATAVKKMLEGQLNTTPEGQTNWVTEVMKLAVAYAQITSEEEGLWNIDVNIFLSEETSVTANFTPRTACGELAIKLGEWLPVETINGLLTYTRTLYSTEQDWKAKEAALYIFNQLLGDYEERSENARNEAVNGSVDFIRYAVQQKDEFLRARGYSVAGSLTKASKDESAQYGVTLGQVAVQFMDMTVQAINNDSSEVVKVACIRALQFYLQAISKEVLLPVQDAIVSAVSDYISNQDLGELMASDDVAISLVETLRDAILLNANICLTGAALDVLFTIASQAANTFSVISMVTETFEGLTKAIASAGDEPYAQLCAKVLPSLTGAFDVGTLTEESALTNLAAELLTILTEYGSEPLPIGFVATAMPKLNRILLNSNDEELLKSATSAVKNMLMHDYTQLFAWQDESGKGGLEVVLFIIDRLLNPSVEDNAAAQVGGLAAELVEKAGSQRLGPYLMQLLRAVAVRLESASQAQLIQSLILVFARLSLEEQSAHEVVDFLAQVPIGNKTGLEVVMSKWLENSVNFAGYDEIRQKYSVSFKALESYTKVKYSVIALSKLYDLNDARLTQIQVKGDLIVTETTSSRIMTRSRALQNPDQYTVVPATLKILKVLIEELQATSGGSNGARALDQAALDQLEEAKDDDDEWEDDPDTLDLASPGAREGLWHLAPEAYAALSLINNLQALMGFGVAEPERERDDETQAYLIDFFKTAARKPNLPQ